MFLTVLWQFTRKIRALQSFAKKNAPKARFSRVTVALDLVNLKKKVCHARFRADGSAARHFQDDVAPAFIIAQLAIANS